MTRNRKHPVFYFKLLFFFFVQKPYPCMVATELGLRYDVIACGQGAFEFRHWVLFTAVVGNKLIIILQYYSFKFPI